MLREVAEDFNLENPEMDINKLIDDMFETMETAEGLGLAAPQVGISKRLFVIDASPVKEEFPNLENFRKEFINAHIIKRTGETATSNEGCLSIPDIHEDVQRSTQIRIQYYDKQHKFYDEVYKGMSAVIIQHEYDHLDGILFTDRISSIRKKLIRRKLQKISKGNFKPRYKCKLGR